MAKVKGQLVHPGGRGERQAQGEVTRTLPKDVDLDRVEMVPGCSARRGRACGGGTGAGYHGAQL